MTFLQKRLCTEYVFRNESFSGVLSDIKNFCDKSLFDDDVEKLLEDCVISYDHDSSSYVATVYIL